MEKAPEKAKKKGKGANKGSTRTQVAQEFPRGQSPGGGFAPRYYAPNYHPMYHITPPQQHSQALAALILGIISAVVWMVMGLPGVLASIACGILALILGRMALKDIENEPQRYSGAGMAKIGMILGAVGLALPVLMLFVFTVMAIIYVMFLIFFPEIFVDLLATCLQ